MFILQGTYTLLYVKKEASTPSFAAITFGKNLKKLRMERKLTQEELAEALDVTPKHIGDMERAVSFARGELMDKIAAYFDVRLEDLFSSEYDSATITNKAIRMASELLKKNSQDFDKQYGIEIHIEE